MTQFWSDNALITGGEAFQARKAMSLIEALLGFPSTGDTKDIARERQCDGSPINAFISTASSPMGNS